MATGPNRKSRFIFGVFFVIIAVSVSPALADVTGSFELSVRLDPEGTQTEAVKFFFDLQSNLQVNVTISGLTFGPDIGFGTTGIEFSVLNLNASLGALALRQQLVFATPFVSVDVNNAPMNIIPTTNALGLPNGPGFVSYRMIANLNIGDVIFTNESIFEDVDFHGPFDVPARNLDNGDMNGDGCPGICNFDDDGDGGADFNDPQVVSINDDDEDGRTDEDQIGDMNLDGCPGICGFDDDGDGLVDGADLEVTACGAPCLTNDDDEDGLVDEDQGDALFDEDPFGDANNDGCPGVCGVDDDNDGVIDEGAVNDDDEDGRVDEDFGKTVYFLGAIDNEPGNQTPSWAFGNRFQITGQTVSGITVSGTLNLCFSKTAKTVKKRSFNGSVNPGCVNPLVSPEKSLLLFDFLEFKVQNVTIAGLTLTLNGEWSPLKGTNFAVDTTFGLFGIGNLNLALSVNKPSTQGTNGASGIDLTQNLFVTFINKNLFLTLVDQGADFEFEVISLSTNINLGSALSPVRLFSSTTIVKDLGLSGQTFSISTIRRPLTFVASASFFGSGSLEWQSASFLIGADFDPLNIQASLSMTPTGLNNVNLKLGFDF